MLEFFKKYKRTLIITSAVLVLVFAALVAFALYSVNDIFESGKAIPTARQYSEWVGFWLPEDVQNFQAYGEGWQDWLVEAKFELSGAAFAEFVERNKLQLTDSEQVVESSYKLEWFQSSKVLGQYEIKSAPESATSTLTGFYPTIWVDDSKAESVIIYIKAFDT